jgi:hypothetical protein
LAKIKIEIEREYGLAERYVSKLKLIKSYLRTTMFGLQERLNKLAILSIEKDPFVKLDFKILINRFAS